MNVSAKDFPGSTAKTRKAELIAGNIKALLFYFLIFPFEFLTKIPQASSSKLGRPPLSHGTLNALPFLIF
ncbi:hypothetical protein BCY91_12330 [Pelobium manganitolerans]|uniref:Uncharacterized protein n=1 Tax=Pelobium manganitolerans TaxID=1842495 RepID=A0A419S1Q7_9SPHI|nr:hypothetical protein BCY91_12330 [Pelobium manganitolerans]